MTAISRDQLKLLIRLTLDKKPSLDLEGLAAEAKLEPAMARELYEELRKEGRIEAIPEKTTVIDLDGATLVRQSFPAEKCPRCPNGIGLKPLDECYFCSVKACATCMKEQVCCGHRPIRSAKERTYCVECGAVYHGMCPHCKSPVCATNQRLGKNCDVRHEARCEKAKAAARAPQPPPPPPPAPSVPALPIVGGSPVIISRKPSKNGRHGRDGRRRR